MPNFNSLQRLEVAFFGRFLSRFCGRHYLPLFRKLACQWAEVTSEAHLKPSAFTWLLATGNKNCPRGKISCQLFVARLWNLPCCSSWQVVLVLYNATTINPTTELVFRFIEALRADPQWKKVNVRTHTQCEFQPERHFDHFTDEFFQRAVHDEGSQRSSFHCLFQLYGKKNRKKHYLCEQDEMYLIL